MAVQYFEAARRWAAGAVLGLTLVAGCGSDEAAAADRAPHAPPASAEPTAVVVEALTKERNRLLAANKLVDAAKLCNTWTTAVHALAQAEGHKCLANVLVRRADDAGEPVMITGAAQRLAVGGTAPEPRYSGPAIVQAIAALDRAAALNPTDVSIHQGRLFLTIASGDYPRAIANLELSMQALPSAAAETWLEYMASFPRPAANHAVVFARKIVAQYPESASAHVQLGAWLDVTGVEKEAKEHLEQALALDPKHPLAHWRLAGVLEQLGDASGAAEHFEASVALDGELAEERRSEYERRKNLAN